MNATQMQHFKLVILDVPELILSSTISEDPTLTKNDSQICSLDSLKRNQDSRLQGNKEGFNLREFIHHNN